MTTAAAANARYAGSWAVYARENEQRNAVAHTEFGNEFADPHEEHRTRGDDHDAREHAHEVERRENAVLAKKE
ncbi:MAG: hypothetical protein UY74_C0069G0010 [Candidatus Kaiserbacteria bacterium GW2011_GWC2_52_8b]|uniref:Uncharacterized protein n=1 Tax=Candidatus Kaiserbacteria bacterium GW2011_GWC2_52_8b TaxID=1618676 RepID=A0A0G1XED3_9BACT|nr:MAG: hypothetical protein UY74_C0069G0010 [Candidatus Kaiserbacteria bacterium GW2011_GWC2_52_8b]